MFKEKLLEGLPGETLVPAVPAVAHVRAATGQQQLLHRLPSGQVIYSFHHLIQIQTILSVNHTIYTMQK